MKANLGWTIALVLIVVILVAIPLVSMFTGWNRYPLWGGMMGGRGMMGGYGYFFPMGFLWGLFMLAIPIGVVVLLVLGVVSLITYLTRSGKSEISQAAVPARLCPNCGKPAQADWNTCPYCGSPLK
jgi:hypothetical protein